MNTVKNFFWIFIDTSETFVTLGVKQNKQIIFFWRLHKCNLNIATIYAFL